MSRTRTANAPENQITEHLADRDVFHIYNKTRARAHTPLNHGFGRGQYLTKQNDSFICLEISRW